MLSAVFPVQYVLCSTRSRAPAFAIARTMKLVLCLADRVKPADLRHLTEHMYGILPLPPYDCVNRDN